MKRGSKKSPIQNTPKTKEQLEREREIARKRVIVVDKFFPALKEATVSIEEAKMLLQASASLIMEEVMNTMRERTFDEMFNRVIKKLSPDDVKLLELEALFNTIRHENLFVAREIIEGMTRAIQQAEMEASREKKLDDLKFEWGRYLN